MKSIGTIYVVGGGSAGAMAACTIKKFFPEKDVRILEGRDIPVVGVGESTLGPINGWLNIMGIKDEDWMKECGASYKMSIRFEDFLHKGDGGFHYPFGRVNNFKSVIVLVPYMFKPLFLSLFLIFSVLFEPHFVLQFLMYKLC